ncbi:MAG: 16S rRNA (cytosine(1402)-N(4))-methyltransferase RsmH [Clostridia bacterium]
MENQEKPHVRRVRYGGTHPKKYNEKYKELNPEKYADDVAKIKEKGKTPAGMHISICVKEILDILQIKPGQTGLDCTLGYGGHTKAMMECLKGSGHMYATDVDPIESQKTKSRLEDLGFGEDILTIKLRNFAQIDKFADEGIKFDFVLADLGVSSMQIDNPERGFTFKQDGPLDLRLNPEKGITAAQRLKDISVPELEGMLIENSDEPYARQISNAIVKEIRTGHKIDTTKKLAEVITNSLSFIPAKDRKEVAKKSCQRCFQALRIDINNEYEVLFDLLDKLPLVLNENAKVAILTFHSGEDRLVKKAFKQGMRDGVYSDVARDVIRPSQDECFVNSRARSAKLRWAIKA